MSISRRRGAVLVALASLTLGLTASPGPAGAQVAGPVQINEVESSGGTPGDWVELLNTGPSQVDASGWKIVDNDSTHAFSILSAGSTIAPGGHLTVEETALGFGLGGADSVRLYTPAGTLHDSHSWTAHAATTYGRCPDGTGALTTTTRATKGSANDCSSPGRLNEVESSGGSPGDWVERRCGTVGA